MSLSQGMNYPSLHVVTHPQVFPGYHGITYSGRKKVFVTTITVVPRPFQENVRVYYACMGKGMNNGREEPSVGSEQNNKPSSS